MQNAIEVRDWRGRTYLVGPSATELLSRPRTWMLWSACAAMAAIAPMQYGYAAISPQLATAQGLPLASTLIPLAVWLACQAITALATAILLSRGRLQARSALRLGALLSGAALLTVAAVGHPPALSGLPVPTALIVGYGLLGGIGAGLVYGACTQTVARWYPDRPAIRVSVVTGAFAYGTIPLAVAVGLDHDLLGPAFLVASGVAVIVVTAAASLLRTPPSLWWPPEVDPRAWALDRSVLHRQPRAARQFSLGEAARTRCLAVLALILVVAGAIGIFNVIAMAIALDAVGPIMAAFIALMLLLNGSGRSAAVLLAERFGRPRVLSLVLLSLGAGQALLALAGLATRTEAPLGAELGAQLGTQAGAQIETQAGVQDAIQTGVAHAVQAGVPHAVQAGVADAIQADVPHAVQAGVADAIQAGVPHALQADVPHAVQAGVADAIQAGVPHALQADVPHAVQAGVADAIQADVPHALQAGVPHAVQAGVGDAVQAGVQAAIQIEGAGAHAGVHAAVQVGAEMGAAGAGLGAGLLALAGVILAGIGSGACYPLIASLVREYFGDERMSGIHGVVYSAKAVAGSVGVGLAIWGSMDIVAAFLAAAALSIVAVGLCGLLRRPGLPATLPIRVL
ncbi:hypothetical protein GCM10009555_044930 [Acrocarpospora macrocephala]|uniref:MFS transporter n=1 Tax=Acrocarpospora macrocephala TaxID=150177 RepID=A0A5M3WCQ7_9ACTN|nr:hypothetical protein [Acrocarpospora macrocephala]GES06845.1 hypothetical protein Amac_004400 [Acrocarpospora macrocephala]